jgi:hypothetical protein
LNSFEYTRRSLSFFPFFFSSFAVVLTYLCVYLIGLGPAREPGSVGRIKGHRAIPDV